MVQRTNEEVLGYWRRQVEGYEASDQTRGVYCEAQGIKVHQLDYWRWKLQRRSGINQPTVQNNNWISVKIKEEDTGIDLSVGKVRITVRPGFNHELLGEVLQVLAV